MTITESEPTSRTGAHDGDAARETDAVGDAAAGLAHVLTTGDHKVTGRLYISFSLLFLGLALVLGGLVAVERLDVASLDLFDNEGIYFQTFSGYRLAMVFLVVMPLFLGLATAIVPLQVGSPSIAFPRASAAGFWGWLVGGGVLVASFFIDGGIGGGDSEGTALTLISLALVIVSLLLSTVCVATTVIALRAPGMSLRRVPLFAWSMLVASVVWLLTLSVLLSNIAITYVDLRGRPPVRYGMIDQIYGQLNWAFTQPQIYAYAIPVLGIVGSIIPVAAKVRQSQHDVLLAAIAAFGLLGFGAFAQGFTDPGIFDDVIYVAFGIAVVLPLLAFFGGMAATLVSGRKSLGLPGAPLLLGLFGLLLLLGGAVIGVLRVIEPFELIYRSATTAHFNAVLLASVLAAFGGIWFWSPKLFGRMLPEGPGRGLAPLFAIGVAVLAAPDVASGFRGQLDGINAGASLDSGVENLNLVAGIGAGVVVLAGLLLIAGVLGVMGRGPGANTPADPWGGHTLEWATASPPVDGNFAEPVEDVGSEAPLLDVAENETDATTEDA